jgi:hypothetical protein
MIVHKNKIKTLKLSTIKHILVPLI